MSVTGYSRRQIALHWVMAGLMLGQWLLAEGMEHAWDAIERGQEVGFNLAASAHVMIGVLIFLLAVPRVGLRLLRGAPPMPDGEHPVLRGLASVTHTVLYAIILLMPVSGALAWFGRVELAADAHGFAADLMVLFVGLHIAGALFQHLILRSDVLTRMLRAER